MEYNVEKINNHFSTKNKNRKNIFVSTSYPRSDQAPTDSLVEMITAISEKYKNCDFYITDNVVSRDNVIYTGNILYEQKFNIETQSDLISSYPMGEYPHCGSSDNKCRNYKNTIDLIECSYFSTFCDVIIGKSTGTYSYSLVDENIKNNKTKFIGICSLSLASAGLHSIINNKFYSDTKSTEYNLQNYIIGCGGFAKEVYCILKRNKINFNGFIGIEKTIIKTQEEEHTSILEQEILSFNNLDVNFYIGVGSPSWLSDITGTAVSPLSAAAAAAGTGARLLKLLPPRK